MSTEEQDQGNPGRRDTADEPGRTSPDQGDQDRRRAAGGDPDRETNQPDDDESGTLPDEGDDGSDDDERIQPTRPGDKDRDRGTPGA